MKRTLVLFCAGVFAWSDAIEMAWARDCYNPRPLVREGKNLPIQPVCKAMAANLNKFCDQPPMVCGLKIHPSYRHIFSLPDWKPAPPDMAQIEAFIRAPWVREDIKDQVWNRLAPEITAALADKRVRFDAAEVDIYNLGKEELTYRLDLGDCETKNPQITHPADRKTWDWPIQWYSLSIQYAPDVVHRILGRYGQIEGFHGDTFTFKNKTYAYAMSGYMNPATGEAENSFWINRYERVRLKGLTTTSLVMHNVCEIEYDPTFGESK